MTDLQVPLPVGSYAAKPGTSSSRIANAAIAEPDSKSLHDLTLDVDRQALVELGARLANLLKERGGVFSVERVPATA